MPTDPRLFIFFLARLANMHRAASVLALVCVLIRATAAFQHHHRLSVAVPKRLPAGLLPTHHRIDTARAAAAKGRGAGGGGRGRGKGKGKDPLVLLKAKRRSKIGTALWGDQNAAMKVR